MLYSNSFNLFCSLVWSKLLPWSTCHTSSYINRLFMLSESKVNQTVIIIYILHEINNWGHYHNISYGTSDSITWSCPSLALVETQLITDKPSPLRTLRNFDRGSPPLKVVFKIICIPVVLLCTLTRVLLRLTVNSVNILKLQPGFMSSWSSSLLLISSSTFLFICLTYLTVPCMWSDVDLFP